MSQLCFNCFTQKNGGGVCPNCGYDPAEDREKYPSALPQGSILRDRYIVGRVLGQGGFGITYAAQDFATQQRVAIKEYMPNAISSREASGRLSSFGAQAAGFEQGKTDFMKEANALAALEDNEHVVNVLDFFQQNNTAYFVMEFVQGTSLKSYIRMMGGRLGEAEALRVLMPIMEALEDIHAKGLIHRDIAPDNIIVTADGTAKLIDFGAARYSTGEQSMSLDVVLKHGYAPVEQYIRRGRQGPFTDVYAMAATFYYALTGRAPQEAVERTVCDELVPPSALGARLSPSLEAALLKALSLQPENRFSGMGEFAAALKGEITLPKPAAAKPSPEAPAPKPQKKKLLPMLIAAALVLALCIGVGAAAFKAGGKEKQPPEPEQPPETAAPATAEPTPEITPEPTPTPEITPSPEPVDDPTWDYDPLTRTLTISGMGNMEDFVLGYTPDTVPWRTLDFKKVVIEPGVSNIGQAAFFICNSLEEIVIPDTVTRIGKDAFYSCDKLSSIELPDSIVMIAAGAFEGCSSLTEITIPADVVILHDNMFKGCTALERVKLPEGLEYINDSAFRGCEALESIKLPGTLLQIGKYAFYECSSLNSITLPESVTIINDAAFRGCLSLKKINIPKDIVRIGMGAFHDCTALSDVYYNGSEEEWGKHLGSDSMCFESFTEIHFK